MKEMASIGGRLGDGPVTMEERTLGKMTGSTRAMRRRSGKRRKVAMHSSRSRTWDACSWIRKKPVELHKKTSS